MTFSNLTIEMQDLLLVQFSFVFKAVIIFGGLAFALFYLLYWKKNQEQPTPFYSVGIIRLLITILAILQIALFPLILLLLSPDYELSVGLGAFFPIYISLIIMAFVGIMADFFYFIPTYFLKLGGFDFHDKKINKAHKEMQKYFKKNG